MSSSTSAWSPALDLRPEGLSRFDPERIAEAIERGYQEGLERGRADHDARVDAEMARFRSHAEQLFANVQQTTARLDRHEATTTAAFGASVASAAVALAEAILRRELCDETTAAVAAFERALSGLGRRPGARIQMHPDDIELLDGAAIPGDLTLEPNPGLDRGDAVAQTDDRTVDARLSSALERAFAVLDGSS